MLHTVHDTFDYNQVELREKDKLIAQQESEIEYLTAECDATHAFVMMQANHIVEMQAEYDDLVEAHDMLLGQVEFLDRQIDDLVNEARNKEDENTALARLATLQERESGIYLSILEAAFDPNNREGANRIGFR